MFNKANMDSVTQHMLTDITFCQWRHFCITFHIPKLAKRVLGIPLFSFTTAKCHRSNTNIHIFWESLKLLLPHNKPCIYLV